MNIGVFDSGLGGLAILHEILQELPQYNYVFLGDNLRVPYGTKHPKEIRQYTVEAVNFLVSQHCRLIIIACNTATAYTLEYLQQEYCPKYYPNVKILGVIVPAVEAIISSKGKRLGIVATKATVQANIFPIKISEINPELKVFQRATPRLVPLIETQPLDSKEVEIELRKELTPLLEKRVDHLLLGCTHYGLIASQIKKIVEEKVSVISEGKVIAQKLKTYLHNHPEIEKELDKKMKRFFFVTKKNGSYKSIAQALLQADFTNEDPFKLVALEVDSVDQVTK